jgi:protoheme IX farnesyltransferase
MWYDRDIDAVMERTKKRPIPMGIIEPSNALAFGTIITIAAVCLMGLAISWFAAAILAFASFFYIVIYTMWLKRRTPQNIVIGGAAGAFPPMIGWAAVTGDVSLASLALFAIIFMWTPPHFWALALYRSGDYAKAGVPMLPVVSGAAETKRQILLYTLILVPLTFAPYALGVVGPRYAVAAALLGAAFILCAVRVWRADDAVERPAKQMFAYSILYLFLLFAAMTLDGTTGGLL